MRTTRCVERAPVIFVCSMSLLCICRAKNASLLSFDCVSRNSNGRHADVTCIGKHVAAISTVNRSRSSCSFEQFAPNSSRRTVRLEQSASKQFMSGSSERSYRWQFHRIRISRTILSCALRYSVAFYYATQFAAICAAHIHWARKRNTGFARKRRPNTFGDK